LDTLSKEFIYNEERSLTTDFLYLMPNLKLVSIMSCPEVMVDNSPFNILNIFQPLIWIMIFISYLFVLSLNEIKINNRKIMSFIGIDYFSVLLGRGMALLSLEKTFFVLFFSLF
jgi:hypothetical protein